MKKLSCVVQWLIVLFCMVVIIGDNNEAFGCMEDEKIGLLKLKDAINQPFTIFPSWGNELDCCSWEGVICDIIGVSKRIISIYLSPLQDHHQPLGLDSLFFQSNKLEQPFVIMNPFQYQFLDASLFQPFQELQNFTFRGGGIQGFNGSLRLTKLQKLDLRYNLVISHAPRMGDLPSLKYLNLATNNLSDDDFQELKNLRSLELLNLGYNGIAGKIPSSIWALTSLKMLGLSNNMLNGSLPEGICALTNLEELDLSGNGFEGVIPICLSSLTSLRLLDLSDNKFSGSIPSNLFFGLKSLEYVSLSHNLFDGLFSFSSLADNSKLEVFQLESGNPRLKIETENAQWKSPFFQLKILRLLNCIVRVIPSFLFSQYDLRVVYLSSNGMAGELPSWLLTNNSKLESLSLRNNAFSGQLMMQLGSYNAYMSWLDVSMNQVAGEIPAFIGSILPNLTYLNMSRNAIEGSIPSSIENMRNLRSLDLSNNHLSGEIPGDLFNGCEELRFWKLSHNNLGGNMTNFLPKKWSGSPQLQVLYLDNNNFSGDFHLDTLRLPLGGLTLLDISNNSITGRFPDWIVELSSLETLVLSKNHFEGRLPTSFCKLTSLFSLDLSWNNFSDTLPPCTNLSSLRFLHLQGNGFYGPLPSVISRSSTLVTLDVSDNKFSGLIPAWISSLSGLIVLLLKGNLFHGSIPSELCQIENLNILDLAANNLSGSIPPCLSHIPFGKTKLLEFILYLQVVEVTSFYAYASYRYENQLQVNPYVIQNNVTTNVEEEVQFITKSLSGSYKGNFLSYMSGIDLSLNKFTGPIPLDIGNWDNVHSLNFSNNHFNGSIPVNLSSLINLESLDLSHNMLSGKIPSQIIKLNFLSVFSVAYNNLSGPTPTWTGQFVTFDADSYEGNPLLCGLPLDKSCSPTNMPNAKPFAELEQNDSFKTRFLWSFFGSFVVSCIGALVFFYFGTNIPQMFLGWIGIEERAPRRITVELPWNRNK